MGGEGATAGMGIRFGCRHLGVRHFRVGHLLEQSQQGRLPEHAALEHRSQDGELVVEGLAEAPPVVQVEGEGVVTEYPAKNTPPSSNPLIARTGNSLEGLVVVSIHVTGEEVEDRHVHDVVQPPALVVGRDLSDQGAVVRLGLPLGFPPLVVRPPPGVPPHLQAESQR